MTRMLREPSSRRFTTWLLVTGIGLLFILGIGFVMTSFFYWHLSQTTNSLIAHPWKSAVLGVVALIASPFALFLALLLAVTIIGSTAGGIIFVAYVIGFILSIIYVGTTIGIVVLKRIYRGKEPPFTLAMFIGVLLTFLLCRIPYAGFIIYLAVFVFGFGAFLSRRVRIVKRKS